MFCFKEKKKKTYERCSNAELKPRHNHARTLSRAIFRRFLTLGVPISNQKDFSCALSTSARVGATRSCMQKLLAPKSKVERTLINKWSQRSSLWALAQLPRYIVPIPFWVPNLACAHAVKAMFVTRTRAAVNCWTQKTVVRFEIFVRNFWALGCSGSNSGSHGLKFLIFPYLEDSRGSLRFGITESIIGYLSNEMKSLRRANLLVHINQFILFSTTNCRWYAGDGRWAGYWRYAGDVWWRC